MSFVLNAQVNLLPPKNTASIVADLNSKFSKVVLSPKISLDTRDISRFVSELHNQFKGLVINPKVDLQSATRSVSEFKKEAKGLSVDIKSNPTNVRELNSLIRNLGKASQAAQKLTTDTVDTTNAMEALGSQAAFSVRRFGSFVVATLGIRNLLFAIKDGIGDAVKFQDQLVKISQITGKTTNSLSGLVDEIFRLSKTFGVTGSKLIEGTNILAQAGLTAQQTARSLELLAKIDLSPTFSDDVKANAEGLVTILHQFGGTVDGLRDKFDAINEVSKRYAIESSDIVAATKRAGGSFAAAGGDLNQFIALFTSVRDTTRESAESIATGFRTIFSRIQRPRTLEFLQELGIELRDLKGQFVTPFEAIRRLHDALDGISTTDPRFAQITEELGGYRQISKVIPLIKEFAKSEEALGVAIASTGSLEQDAVTAQESLIVQFQKLKAELASLLTEVIRTDVFKDMTKVALETATAIVRITDSVKDLLPLLGFLGLTKLTIAAPSFLKGFKNTITNPSTRLASGGLVPGRGNRDTVEALLTPGEFVLNKKAVQALGISRLDKFNKVQKFASGGLVQTLGKYPVASSLLGGLAASVATSHFGFKGFEGAINALIGGFVAFSAILHRKSDDLQKEDPAQALANSIKGYTTTLDEGSKLLEASVKNLANVLSKPATKAADYTEDISDLLDSNSSTTKNPVTGKLTPISRTQVDPALVARVAASRGTGHPTFSKEAGFQSKHDQLRVGFGISESFALRNNYRLAPPLPPRTPAIINFPNSGFISLDDFRASSPVDQFGVSLPPGVSSAKHLKRLSELRRSQTARKLDSDSGFQIGRSAAAARAKDFAQFELDAQMENFLAGNVSTSLTGYSSRLPLRQRILNSLIDKNGGFQTKLRNPIAGALAFGGFTAGGSYLSSLGQDRIRAGTGGVGLAAAGSTLSFAAQGAALGSFAGPAGLAIGAVVGGLYGFTTALSKAKKDLEAVKFDNSLTVFKKTLDEINQGLDPRSRISILGSGLRSFENRLNTSDGEDQISARADLNNSLSTISQSFGKVAEESKSLEQFVKLVGHDTLATFAALTNRTLPEVLDTYSKQIESQQAAIKSQKEFDKATIATNRRISEIGAFAEIVRKAGEKLEELNNITGGLNKRLPENFSDFSNIGKATSLSTFVGNDAFLQEFRAARQVSSVLPNILSSIRRQPLDAEGGVLSAISKSISQATGLNTNNPVITTLINQIKADIGAGLDTNKFLADFDKDPNSVIEKLRASLTPLLDIFKELDRVVSSAVNDFSTKLREVANKQQEIVDRNAKAFDSLSSFSRLVTSARDERPNFTLLRQLDQARTNNFTGGRGVPELRFSLLASQDRILELNEQIQRADRDSIKDLILARDAEITNVERTTKALEYLANAADRTAILQEQLQKSLEDSKNKRDFATQFSFAGIDEQRNIARNIQLAQQVAQQGNVNNLTEKQRGDVLSLFQRFKELPLFGGLTGQQAINKVNRQFGIPELAGELNPEQQALIGAIADGFNNANQANQALNDATQNSLTSIDNNLKSGFDNVVKAIYNNFNGKLLENTDKQLTDLVNQQNNNANQRAAFNNLKTFGFTNPEAAKQALTLVDELNKTRTQRSTQLNLRQNLANKFGLLGYNPSEASVDNLLRQSRTLLSDKDIAYFRKLLLQSISGSAEGSIFDYAGENAKNFFLLRSEGKDKPLADQEADLNSRLSAAGGSQLLGIGPQALDSLRSIVNTLEDVDTNKLQQSADAIQASIDALNSYRQQIPVFNTEPLARASGGIVPGVGNTDSVHALLTPGEFVLRKSAVNALGYGFVSSLNRYAAGGIIRAYRHAAKDKKYYDARTQQLEEKYDTKDRNDAALKAAKARLAASKAAHQQEIQSGIDSENAFQAAKKRQKTLDETSAFQRILDSRRNKVRPKYYTDPGRYVDVAGIRAITHDPNLTKQQKYEARKKLLGDRGVKTHNLSDAQLAQRNYDIQQIANRATVGERLNAGTYQEKLDQAATDRIIAGGSSAPISNEEYKRKRQAEIAAVISGGKRYATGGYVDSVPAMLTPGEFVVNRAAVNRLGVGYLHNLNRYADGGYIEDLPRSTGVGLSPARIARREAANQVAGREIYNNSGANLEQINNAINSFNKISETLSQALNNFPREVSHSINGRVEVIMNGGEILAKMQPDLEEMVTTKIKSAISQFAKDKFPELPS